jgi:hypothetical protein
VNMGDVIYVDFKTKKKRVQRCSTGDDLDLERRLANIDGSVKRLNGLIKELKNPYGKEMTSEELNKFLDDIYTRR